MLAQKTRLKAGLIVGGAVAVIAVVVVVLLLVLPRGILLKNALKRLDINNEATVIGVMKYGGNDPETVLKIASLYRDAAEYTQAVKLLIYAAQYLEPSDEVTDMLRDCCARLGADETLLGSLCFTGFTPSDFEPVSSYAGKEYGFSDGVYTRFCGGYARARISAIIPQSLAAVSSGVYVLDCADKYLKFISEDGLTVKIISETPLNEFVLYADTLYTIESDGVPRVDGVAAELSDGEQAMELRVEQDTVLCTVYDQNYNRLRDITL